MTNLLCSLANGRVVVALEVFGISYLVKILPGDRSIGRLQPRIHLGLGAGSHEDLAG